MRGANSGVNQTNEIEASTCPWMPKTGAAMAVAPRAEASSRPYDARWAILAVFSSACPPGALTESRESNSSSESGL